MKILKWYPHVRYPFIAGNVTFTAFASAVPTQSTHQGGLGEVDDFVAAPIENGFDHEETEVLSAEIDARSLRKALPKLRPTVSI
jgi:hypothetical protein